MKYCIQKDEFDNVLKLYLSVHKVDDLLLSEEELNGLYFLIVNEVPEGILINQYFSKKRLDDFEKKRIVFKSKVLNGTNYYRMKNKHYKIRIVEYFSKILSLDNEYKAFDWAEKNGYSFIEINELQFCFIDEIFSKDLK